MPEELNDYSGPFRPDLTFDCFSKEFLLKPICEVQQPAVIAKYLINPKVELKALKLPSHRS